MTERIYKHRTAAEHYMQAQMHLAHAEQNHDNPAQAALYLQAAQVHATLATAHIEPFIDSARRGPISVTEHGISLFRGEMGLMGLNPDEWELDDIEKHQG